LLFDNTLVWSIGRTTYGLSPATGEVLWENTNEECYNDHSLRQVTLGDRHLAFVAGHRYYNPSNVRLIDPASGQSLWTEQVGHLGVYEGMFANTLAITGDTLVAFQAHVPKPDPKTGKINKADVTHHLHAWKLSTSGIEHLWQDDHLPPDEGPHLAIGDGVVCGVGRHLVRCLDLETGKVLGEITKDEFPHPPGSPHGDAPGSNPLLIVAGDKLILSPEGQHGKHGFVLFDADPTKLTLYGNQEKKWVPPHASTTAYGRQPIVNPIVDGRMFFRGGNGIYCYDLRK
jgi:outer membrane protein assembly factor BamB